MKTLFLSNSHIELVAALGNRLFSTELFPLKKRFVVVPHKRTKELLLEYFVIRSETASCAGLQFYTLFELIEYFASVHLKEIVKFPRDGILALYLEEKIGQYLENEAFAPVKDYLNGDLSKIQDLAISLAKTFKSYDLYGTFTLPVWLKEIGWQQILWKEAFSVWPFFTKLSFERISIMAAELHIFGLSHIPETVRGLLEQIEKNCETHYYLFSPTEYYSGDLSTDRQRLFLQKYFTKKGVRQEECNQLDLYARNRNSLLANFGVQSTELFAYFVDREIFMEESYIRADDTLLGNVKNDILDLRNPEEDNTRTDKEISGINLHTAPSKLREVEILYNDILGLFAKDPSLSFQDVVIFAPKIAIYYPYIQMIFGSPDSLLPNYAISDLPIVLSSKKFQSLEKFLQLPNEKTDLFDLFYSEGFLEKFGLTQIDIDTWKRWIKRAPIKDDVLDRLVISLAIPLEEEDPLPSINPSEAPILEILLSICKTISSDLEILQKKELSIKEWSIFLRECIQRYFEIGDEGLTPFINHLGALLALETKPVPFSTIQAYLEEFFEIPSYTYRPSTASPLLFSDLGEGHMTLAKHIFLIGMDEESFPSPSLESPLNELTKISQPSSSDRDRFGFLTALLSAEKSLTISYQNIHPQDGKVVGASLIVRQLFDYLDEYYLVQGKPPSKKCSFDHPGISFHKSYFSEDGTKKSFSPKDYRFASYHYGEKQVKNSSQKQEKELLTIWNLKDLSRLHNPLRFYAQSGLGIYLEEMKPQENCNDEFILSFFDKYRFKAELGKKDPSFLLDQFKKYTPIRGDLFQKIAANELMKDFKKPISFLKKEGWSYENNFTITFHEDCKNRFKKNDRHWVLPPLFIENYQIIGSLLNLTPLGLLSFSKSKWKEACRQWPNLLIINILKKTFPVAPKILFAELGETEDFVIENPEKELLLLLEYANLIFQNPCPFSSDWFDLIHKEAEWKKAFAESKDPYIELFQDGVVVDPWIAIVRNGYGSLSINQSLSISQSKNSTNVTHLTQ
jgi:exonuclease V gamma subunit